MSDSEDADYIFRVEDKLRELTAERSSLRSEVDALRAQLAVAKTSINTLLDQEKETEAERDRLAELSHQYLFEIDRLRETNVKYREALEKIASSWIEKEEDRPTSQWSLGNYDDVFTDGITKGEHYAAGIAKAALNAESLGEKPE